MKFYLRKLKKTKSRTFSIRLNLFIFQHITDVNLMTKLFIRSNLSQVPSTFILLTVFYLCNLNNVSWGTRETPKKLTPEEEEAQKLAEEEKLRKKKSWNIFTSSGLLNIIHELRELVNNAWGLSAELKNQAQPATANNAQMLPIQQKPDAPTKAVPQKEKKLEYYQVPGYEPDPNRPYWVQYDPVMGKGVTEDLDNEETDFWKFLIKKYLHVIEENKEQKDKISNDLLEIRNNMVFIYILLNFLWTVIAMQLQASQVCRSSKC